MSFLLWQRRMGRYASSTIEDWSLLNSDFISILYPKSMYRYHLALPVSPHKDWAQGTKAMMLLSYYFHFEYTVFVSNAEFSCFLLVCI